MGMFIYQIQSKLRNQEILKADVWN